MGQFRILLLLLTTCCLAQPDNRLVKEQAEQTAKALLTGDYETLLRFTYPKVIELVGGRDKMVSLIKKGKIEMAQQGVKFDRVLIGSPSRAVVAGEEIHCLIPETIYMVVPNGKMMSETQLIAVSRDKGTHWYFIDAVKLNNDNIKTVLPRYNFELVLPEKKQPVFIPD